MPIYEYSCSHCGKTFEEWLRSDDDSSAHPCPDCGQSAQRCISNTSFILKGGGWYVTEYGGRGTAANSACAASGPSEAQTGKTEDSGPTDSGAASGGESAASAPAASTAPAKEQTSSAGAA